MRFRRGGEGFDMWVPQGGGKEGREIQRLVKEREEDREGSVRIL